MITSITIEKKHEGYGNEHLNPVVVVDERVNRDELIFSTHTKVSESKAIEYTFYWAADENGLAHFIVDDPSNRRGFGGAKMTFNTEGGVNVVVGPWSSRCSVLNQWFPHSIECTLIDTQGHRFASAILISVLQAHLEEDEGNDQYMLTHTVSNGDEIRYEIKDLRL